MTGGSRSFKEDAYVTQIIGRDGNYLLSADISLVLLSHPKCVCHCTCPPRALIDLIATTQLPLAAAPQAYGLGGSPPSLISNSVVGCLSFTTLFNSIYLPRQPHSTYGMRRYLAGPRRGRMTFTHVSHPNRLTAMWDKGAAGTPQKQSLFSNRVLALGIAR